MKKSTFLKSFVAGLLLLAIVTPPMTLAAAEDKAETIKGEGKCGKCALKETEKCQNVIQVEKDGKKITYYLVDKEGSDVSKKFHENLCKESKKVTATGTVKEVAGKKQLTVTKLDLVKD